MYRLFTWAPIPEDGTSMYRAWGPLSQLRRITDKIELVRATGSVNWVDYLQLDGAFLQRPFLPNQVQFASECKAYGIPLLTDWDDDLLNVPEDNPTHGQYSAPQSKQNVETLARMSDCVISSTAALAEVLKPFNQTTHIVRNALDPRLLVRMPQETPRNPIVMWRGGHTHQRDLREYTDAILACYEANPTWSFVFMGYNPWWIKERMSPERYRHVPFNPQYAYYMRDLAKVRAAIHIVPLADNKFNRSKSDIAYLEATAAGSVVLGPDWEEWQSPSLVNYKDPSSFQAKLQELMNTPIEQLGSVNEKAWQHVLSNRTLTKENNNRLNLFKRYGGMK